MEKPANAATVGVEGLELKLQAQFPTPFQTYSSCVRLFAFSSVNLFLQQFKLRKKENYKNIINKHNRVDIVQGALGSLLYDYLKKYNSCTVPMQMLATKFPALRPR
jgi:sulfite reductase alpha subunit-like flavoprotein